jgi:predicted acylesterase/phospholipase RssA
MNIKHLVISGGGPSMLQYISAIQCLCENNIIQIDNIESIYGTSAGIIVGVLLALKYDWETLNDYILKRPWHELFNFKIHYIFDAYKNRGVYNKNIFEKAFKPLLDAKDIPIAISLKDFYDHSKIELHFFTFEINQFKTEDISYLTHPDISLIDAIIMSCSIPLLCTPIIMENKCYIDGGVCANYPLKYCLDSGKNEKEILGLCNQYDCQQKNYIDSESNLLDFILCLFFKIFNNLSSNIINPTIQYEIKFDVKYLSLQYLKSAITSIEIRKELYQKGTETATEFLNLLEKG